ncbi:MAG: hypothetical protein COS71_00855 [Candidatus Moranbacteria bacterium CG06_land_8_20_14_3_00_40_12]|nr:MAG: hypothetical protein COS71_00855 [Candidatus Moranbacteria bacterium CG06_land_8_20_14_3_00_40_12]
MDNEELIKRMDEDAVEAKKEFDELPIEARKIISSWVFKWYMKTGFKRLGRMMVSFAKEKKE